MNSTNNSASESLLHSNNNNNERDSGAFNTDFANLRMRSPSHRDIRYKSGLNGTPADAGSKTRFQTVVQGLLYGVINSILTIPCMFGYAAIIYRHKMFHEQLPELSKLVLFSSVVHQCVFTVLSSLSFSIGQVQDAGLIFLSTMATAIASTAEKDAVIPTTLVTLSLYTALLGLVVFVIGRLRLANLVAFLPMPVVGGYLAFIGFFCFEAGIGLATGADLATIADFTEVANTKMLLLALPAVLGGGLLTVVSHKAKHWLALPIAMLILPIGFYATIYMAGMSLQDARDDGWVSHVVPDAGVGQVFSMFEFDKVQWELVPRQVLTWVSMTLVVAFSSCLDVVAIEMDMGSQLDINHELSTVGISNIISGLLGGYTGSYIFSQTIFTFRTGTDSRLIGLVVILAEFGLFLVPTDIMQFVPKFFFAATLIFIAFDLLAEWLVAVWFKVAWKEYMILLGTFLCILITDDLILGIGVGIALSVVNFIIAYASVAHITAEIPPSSNVVRAFERRKLLADVYTKEVAYLSLHGYLFFGSTNQIVSRVRQLIQDREEGVEHNDGLIIPTFSPSRPDLFVGEQETKCGPFGCCTRRHQLYESSNSESPSCFVQVFQYITCKCFKSHSRVTGSHGESQSLLASRPHYMATMAHEPIIDILSEEQDENEDRDEVHVSSGKRFLVLDMQRVTGIDATAISTGLMRMKQLAMNNNVSLVFVALRPEFQVLLVKNGVIDPTENTETCVMFDHINDGLDWVEQEIINSHFDEFVDPEIPSIPFAYKPNGAPGKKFMNVRQIPKAVETLETIYRDFLGWETVDSDLVHSMADYFGLMRLRKGDMVFDLGEDSNLLYIVMSGEVALFVPPTSQIDSNTQSTENREYMLVEESRTGKAIPCGRLLQRVRYGSIFGNLHFVLREERRFAAVATEESALFFLTRTKFAEMETKAPRLAIGFYQCLAMSLSLEITQDVNNH